MESANEAVEEEREDGAVMHDCTRCNFRAWDNVQLHCHMTWHEAGSDVSEAFVCPLCPCTVKELHDFRFHLQFHKADSKGKYFQCVDCSFRSNVESCIDAHHKAEHVTNASDDSSDDEGGSYIVKKFKVTFHNGNFHCPEDGCSETYGELPLMQLHFEALHDAQLEDKYLYDFCAGAKNPDVPVEKTTEEKEEQEQEEEEKQEEEQKQEEEKETEEANTRVEKSAQEKEIETLVEEIKTTSQSLFPKPESIIPVSCANMVVFPGADPTYIVDSMLGSGDSTALENSEQSEEFTPEPIMVVPEGCDPEDRAEDNNPIHFGTEFESDAKSIHNESPTSQLFERLTTAMGLGEDSQDRPGSGLIEVTPREDMTEENVDTIQSRSPDRPSSRSDAGDNEATSPPPTRMENFTDTTENGFLISVDEIKTEDLDDVDDVEAEVNSFHCDMCEFCTNTQEAFIEHIKSVHDIEVVSMEPDDSAGNSESPVSRPQATSTASRTNMSCTVCPYVTSHRRNFKKHMDIHKKVDAYSGPAFKCGYCPYIAMSKGPGCNHVRNLHADQPFKLYYVEKIGKKITLQQEVPMNKAVIAMEKAQARAVAGGGDRCPQQDALAMGGRERRDHYETPYNQPGLHAPYRKESGQKGAAHRGENGPKASAPGAVSDWFAELTKEEAAFCDKVSGLMKYQCKLCPFTDDSCGKVRVHYVAAHPDELPILCGYCRERCESDTFRRHHVQCHQQHPVKIIRQVLQDRITRTQLELYPGETEIEEVVDHEGLNDWTAAMRDFVVMETSGTYRCLFCNYKQYGTSALKRHVFPIHFKCYPYMCHYCKIGMTQVNQLRNHIEKMHQGLPIRVHRPLPTKPTDDQIKLIKESTEARPITDSPRTLASSSPNSSQPATRHPSPVRTPPLHYAGSPVNANATRSPTSRTIKSPLRFQDGFFLDPNTVKREKSDPNLSPGSGELMMGVTGSGERTVGRKKTFRCHYCSHSSKWTGRDVQRHILTTHLGLKLFNCVYCEFGCYSRYRLETHCATEHSDKPFKVSNLDKRINSVQVVREEPDGVDVLALFKPSGEPVLYLDSNKKAVLRKLTLSGKYQVMSRPQDHGIKSRKPPHNSDFTASTFPQSKSVPLNKYQGHDLSPEEKGKLMRPSVKENPKQAWKCRLCDLVLTRCDRIKYHIICHHWKLRPYMCPMCETYKYQREPVLAHMREEHPGCMREPISVCDAKLDQLNRHLEKIDDPEEISKLTEAGRQAHTAEQLYQRAKTNPGHDDVMQTTPMQLPIISATHASSNDCASGEEEEEEQEGGEGVETGEDEEDLEEQELWQCLELDCGFVGPYQPVQNHVLQKHLRSQVYLCDYCSATRNEIERMVEHLRMQHADLPKRFSHAYGRYKESVDRRIGRLTHPPGAIPALPAATALQQARRRSSAASSIEVSLPERARTPKSYGSDRSSLASPNAAPVTCPACKAALKNQADFDWHLADEHPQFVKYQCGYCDELSDSKRTLKEHMVDMHSDKPPEYSMVRNLPSGMDPNQQTHSSSAGGGKVCKMCGFAAQSLALLNQHLETTHLSQVLFQCKLCSGLHKTKDDLLTHYGVLHRNDSLQYKVVPLGADEDDKEEGQIVLQPMPRNEGLSNSVSNNLEVEDGTEMYECDHCAYISTNAADFKQHLLIHTQKNKSALTEGRGHTNISKPTARKSAPPSSSQLQQQLLSSDSGDSRTSSPAPQQFVKHYECRHCPYVTRECVSIRRHVMTHVHYHPYKCPHCDIASIRSNAIKAHMYNIHKVQNGVPLLVKDEQMEAKVQEGITKVFGDTPKSILRKKAGYLPPLSKTMNAHSPFAKGLNKPKKSQGNEMTSRAMSKHPPKSAGLQNGNFSEAALKRAGVESPKKGMKFVCKICKYVVYGITQNIRRHVMIHFNYKKYKCPYCEFATIQSHGVTQHVMTSHPGLTPRYLTFSQADLERKIQENIIRTGEYAGSGAASKATPAVKAVQSITKKYTGIGVINRKSQLGISKKKKYHVDESKIPPGRLLYYKCKICNFTENSSLRKCTNMRRHVMSHLDYRRYRCKLCDFASTTTCMTKAHVRRRHPGAQPSYIDAKDERLEKAMRANIIKVGGKPYTTYTYQDSGVKATDLKPSPEKPFPRFSKQPKPIPMVDPENADEGNYQCLICNRRTLNGTTMKRHIASHFNYRRYGCPYCELLFTQSTFVLNHVRAKHHSKRLYYLDNKVAETEEKIRASWVNLKEADAKSKSGTVPVVARNDQSKLKILLTLPKNNREEHGSDPDLNFLEGEVDDNSGFEYYNGDAMSAENSDAASSTNTVEYDKIPEPPEEDQLESNALPNETSNGSSGSLHSGVLYKCTKCTYVTEQKTSMLKHIMWKIGYKPYRCPHCGFQDVMANGLRKHCVRRHKGMSQTPLLCKDASKEYEVEQLMAQATCTPPPQQPAKRQHQAVQGPTDGASPSKKVKKEADVETKRPVVTKQMFDEPVDEKIVYRSQIKLQCQLCGKKSTSRGYIYNHVLRHGPPRLKCGYCAATMYFPREAKTHSNTKHPGEPLNIKRLWGNRTWDHKNEGIERASADDLALTMGGDYSEVKAEPAETDGYMGDVPARLPKPKHARGREQELEDTIMERTPVKIPKRNAATGYYQCVFCEYQTTNPNHIKCHVLVHEPPHWRCDHCKKRFVMLYKLRKHTTLVHRLPLRYTNLVTGETCNGTSINYAGAVFESPSRARSLSPKRPYSKSAAVGGSSHRQGGPAMTHPADVESDAMSEASDESQELQELIFDCHKCTYRTFSDDELLQHLRVHSDVRGGGQGDESGEGTEHSPHFRPSVVVSDFLKLSIESLHTLMVEHGLEEIHQ